MAKDLSRHCLAQRNMVSGTGPNNPQERQELASHDGGRFSEDKNDNDNDVDHSFSQFSVHKSQTCLEGQSAWEVPVK